jgi:hypothetical protein
MTDNPPTIEFGKRRPAPLPSPPPATPSPKRSSHVALLMMGAFAVGGGAYFVMLRQNCQPPTSPGMAAPALPQTEAGATSCTSGIYSGHGGSRSRFSFFGGSSSSSGSISGSESSSGVSRGGFGSFAHAFGFGGG